MHELTTTQAAAVLGLDPSSVRRLARAGDLKPARVVGSLYLFDFRAVERLKQRREGEVRPGRPAGKRNTKGE